ncbi:hypothetical protein BD410DRAFT_62505 [Rickenella mellea]|uniref:RRM domain-containing protein n=1 Tax=Rickenella mellea TaxID=50990 RepID=A0A4Y7QCI7_9AGAM|nr:hypothetical protein BD410DRAFT_62505 [Rickenella mellea]
MSNIVSYSRRISSEVGKHVQLNNVPRSALPSDLRRLIRQAKLEHVASVQLQYHRFMPDGRAIVTLTHPKFFHHAIDALTNSTISAVRIEPRQKPATLEEMTPNRLRGARGRAEAAERGILDGTGPGAGISAKGKEVVMWGLPGRLATSALVSYLQSKKLVREDAHGQPAYEVLKIGLPPRGAAQGSKHVVRLPSIADAHRLVRRLHMTYFQQESWGKRYQIQARVVY